MSNARYACSLLFSLSWIRLFAGIVLGSCS